MLLSRYFLGAELPPYLPLHNHPAVEPHNLDKPYLNSKKSSERKSPRSETHKQNQLSLVAWPEAHPIKPVYVALHMSRHQNCTLVHLPIEVKETVIIHLVVCLERKREIKRRVRPNYFSLFLNSSQASKRDLACDLLGDASRQFQGACSQATRG